MAPGADRRKGQGCWGEVYQSVRPYGSVLELSRKSRSVEAFTVLSQQRRVGP